MKYLIKKKDGSVGIMTTVSDDVNPIDEIAKWKTEEREKVDSVVMIDGADVPEDRYFRGAWTHNNGKLHIDMEKCREIHKDKLREIRNPILESLDLEYMKAIERQDSKGQLEIVNQKNRLRDVTISPEILNAQTPEELKSFVPEFLL